MDGNIANTIVQSRSNSECGPQGICEEPELHIYDKGIGNCTYRFIVDVTKCVDGSGNEIYYFEELEFGVNEECEQEITTELKDQLYSWTVTDYMKNEVTLQGCWQGSSATTSSRQITMLCKTYCNAEISEGMQMFRPLRCKSGDACCVTEKKWCTNGSFPVVIDTEVDLYGSCFGTPVDPCTGQYNPYVSFICETEDKCE